MRIAMMTNNYKPFVGGVPISIERLADSLRDLGHSVYVFAPDYKSPVDDDEYTFRFLYKGIIIKHNKTEPTYTKTSLFLCEKRRFFMARTEKGVVATI